MKNHTMKAINQVNSIFNEIYDEDNKITEVYALFGNTGLTITDTSIPLIEGQYVLRTLPNGFIEKYSYFDKVMKNLEYISQLKKDQKIDEITLVFIINTLNYKEMKDFVKIAKKLDAKISFSVSYFNERFSYSSTISGNTLSELYTDS